MNIDVYEDLTGNTVEAEEQGKVTAEIRRARITLQTMLGYTLDKQKSHENHYDEKGKAKVACPFRGIISDINDMELDPADEVKGSYRLFNYNSNDQYLEVDPFTKLYSVKLVFVQSGGEDADGITHKTFSDGKIRVHKKNGVSKYIERCKECFCLCDCDDCVQIAVDADWLNEDCLPEDLLMVWASMVEYACDDKSDIIAETLGTHSYRREASGSPETMDENIAIIKRYAGPNGTVNTEITV